MASPSPRLAPVISTTLPARETVANASQMAFPAAPARSPAPVTAAAPSAAAPAANVQDKFFLRFLRAIPLPPLRSTTEMPEKAVEQSCGTTRNQRLCSTQAAVACVGLSVRRKPNCLIHLAFRWQLERKFPPAAFLPRGVGI